MKQSYSNLELIIVDDASTDTTPQLIEKWLAADRRVRAIRHEVNRKLPAALNTGFRVAAGEYLTWTSDDNLYRTNAVETMVQALEEHPEVDIVYAGYTQIDGHGLSGAAVAVKSPETTPLNNWVGCCFLYRRKVHERLGGYDEQLFLAEDYDFWLRATASFRFLPLSTDLYLYRRHDGMLTNTRQEAIARAVEETIRRNLPAMTWLTRQDKALFYMNCAMAASYRNEFGAARQALCRAFFCSCGTVCSTEYFRLILRLLLGWKRKLPPASA